MPRGLGTARISSTYIRPNIKEINKSGFDSRLADLKQIGPNMWAFPSRKSYIYRGAYITTVILKRGSKYYSTDIPTDKNGRIKQVVMAERLLDTESGDRQGHIRNALIDIGVNALKRYNDTELDKVYQWYLYPNETDIKGLDDINSNIIEIYNKDKKVGYRSKVIITGGTASNREKVVRDIANNFTNREKSIINNCLIEITGSNSRYAGCFQGKTDSSGNIIGVPRIVVTKPYVGDADVIVHECIHALRQFDPKRDYRLKAVEKYWGRDADLEESLTEAETTGRKKPFKEMVTAGYYHYIKIPNKSSSGLMVEDRITITGDTAKGLKGKRLEKKVLLKYPLTNIAHLKIKGNAEAIDTFYKLDDKDKKTTEHLHVYNPKGTKLTDRAMDSQLKSEFGGKITQFEDKKPVIISRGTTRITPKRPRIS